MRSAAPHCIALVGFRASGKTTLGALLAASLQRPFFDLDREIELAQGRTVRDLIEQEGEEAFRGIEEETLAGIVPRPGIVLAPGGGAILRSASRELLKQRCFTVFLDVELPGLLARLRADPGRPRLTTLAFEEEVRALVAARAPLYRECADVVLPVPSDETAATTFAHLCAALPT